MRPARALFVLAGLILPLATLACTVGGDEQATDETSGAESPTGDGDGDTDPSSGDGDGDPTTGDGDGDPTTGGQPDCGAPPTNAATLDTWLAGGSYLAWPAESAIHDSSGPHFGGVRTYIDDCLDGSLASGNAEHPVGSTAVKELYGEGEEIRGYSVMIKVEEGAGDQGWYWYEIYDGSVFGEGVGAGICTGCHGAGSDFFLSPYPLQ